MKYLIDFIKVEDVSRAKIFTHLKCSIEEATILQHIVKKEIEGTSENSVYSILVEMFSHDNYEYIEKVLLIQHLLHLGWLNISSLFEVKSMSVSALELINSSVTLSKNCHKLLEDGSLEVDLPDMVEYSDHLEYLRDQFSRIEIYQKISAIRSNYPDNTLSIDRLQNRLGLLEVRIAERVNATKISLSVE